MISVEQQTNTKMESVIWNISLLNFGIAFIQHTLFLLMNACIRFEIDGETKCVYFYQLWFSV